MPIFELLRLSTRDYNCTDFERNDSSLYASQYKPFELTAKGLTRSVFGKHHVSEPVMNLKVPGADMHDTWGNRDIT